ncbi:MAG: transporter [Caulobacter sp.]|nr:transporter [Caulobacter sp.]
MAHTGNHAPSGKLKTSALAAFAMAGVPVGALATPLVVYLPNFFAAYIGIPLATVGLIFMAVKVLDLIFDPTAGMFMDQTRTRVGRYRFWLLLGTPVLMLGVYMLFLAPKGAGAGYLTLWLIVFYIGYSLLVLSQSAWGVVLARTYAERSNVFAGVAVAGAIGAAGVLVAPTLMGLKGPATVQAMGWIILVMIPICVLIVAFGVREPVLPRREGADRINIREIPSLILQPSMIRLLATDLLLTLGPGFTAPLYLFFFKAARGYSDAEAGLLLVVYIVAGVVAAPLWALVANRLQKHRTLLVSALLYALAQALVMLVPAHSILPMTGAMFLAGGIAAAFGFLIRAMVADVADEVRLQTGKERAGLLYAFITSTVKIGTASSLVTFPLLSLFGFDAKLGAANTPQAMQALVLTYVALPVVAVALGGLVMLTYRLDRTRHAEIRAQLDARDAALGVHLDPPVPPISAIETA